MTTLLELAQILAIVLLIPAASILIVGIAVALVDDGRTHGRHRGTPQQFTGCHRMDVDELTTRLPSEVTHGMA